jgi:hypothetical protein
MTKPGETAGDIKCTPTGAETPDFPGPGRHAYSDPGIVPFGRLSQ